MISERVNSENQCKNVAEPVRCLTGLLPVPCLTGVLPAHEDDVDAKDALAGAAQPDAGGL